MTRYTIHIVLHGANAKDYERLHELMDARGARRALLGEDGVWYDLPDGEYDLESDYAVEEVVQRTGALASAVKPNPSILVTPVQGRRMWWLRPVPEDS